MSCPAGSGSLGFPWSSGCADAAAFRRAAASWILLNRWESPALLTGGSNFPPVCKRHFGVLHPQAAACCNGLGRVSSAPASSSVSIARRTCTAACIGFCPCWRFAVERRLVLLRISLYMRCSMMRMAALARAHKGQQIFQMVAGFDIYGVGPLAHGAVGIELILGQNALQLLRKRVPGQKGTQCYIPFPGRLPYRSIKMQWK